MLAGVTIVDPQTTWIDPTVELEPDADRSIRSPCFAARRASRRAPRSAPHASRSTRAIGAGAMVGPVLLPSPWDRPRATPRRRAHSWRSRTHASGTARRCLTCPTSATQRSAPTRTSAPAAITANFPHEPGQPKGRTTIGEQRQDRHPQWLRRTRRDRGRCMDRGRFGDHRGCAAGRPRGIPDRAGEQGGLCSPAAWRRRLSSRLPGLELPEAVTQP